MHEHGYGYDHARVLPALRRHSRFPYVRGVQHGHHPMRVPVRGLQWGAERGRRLGRARGHHSPTATLPAAPAGPPTDALPLEVPAPPTKPRPIAASHAAAAAAASAHSALGAQRKPPPAPIRGDLGGRRSLEASHRVIPPSPAQAAAPTRPTPARAAVTTRSPPAQAAGTTRPSPAQAAVTRLPSPTVGACASSRLRPSGQRLACASSSTADISHVVCRPPGA